MFYRLYGQTSSIILDYWFDKMMAKIAIANRIDNGNGPKFDYKNQGIVMLNMEEVLAFLNWNYNNIQEPFILQRSWSGQSGQENTIITFLRSETLSIEIKKITNMGEFVWTFIGDTPESKLVFNKYMEACTNLLPSLNCYLQNMKWNSNNKNSTNTSKPVNQNNFNQQQNNNFNRQSQPPQTFNQSQQPPQTFNQSQQPPQTFNQSQQPPQTFNQQPPMNNQPQQQPQQTFNQPQTNNNPPRQQQYNNIQMENNFEL